MEIRNFINSKFYIFDLMFCNPEKKVINGGLQNKKKLNSQKNFTEIYKSL